MFQIDEQKISNLLNKKKSTDPCRIQDILVKGRELKGISETDIMDLLNIDDESVIEKIHETAAFIKDEIYGKRLVLFAPLYLSNYCNNECSYCAFRHSNDQLTRKSLDCNEIQNEVKSLINSGHKRLLLVAGEDHRQKSFDALLDSIDQTYAVSTPKGNIRRLNINIAPTTTENFKRLHDKKIGTYQLFQETYHRPTYKSVHLKGPKSDYDYRLSVMDRAMEGGIEDVGVGILFGLYDYKYEVLALINHVKHLEEKFGVGPHTISVPRLEPALNSPFATNPPHAISDRDFLKVISILRIAVPYTGIIMSTRENPLIRKKGFDLGVSQVSAGSKTNPGDSKNGEQFSLGDHRSLLEVVKDIVSSGFIPSFCTGCYRNGRVGNDFMDLAKVGLIKNHCLPNGLFSFLEYINDFGDEELKLNGLKLIDKIKCEDLNDGLKFVVSKKLQAINNGLRDIYF